MDFDAANERMQKLLLETPRALSAHLDLDRSEILVILSDGTQFAFPSDKAQGLRGASVTDLSDIEITPTGLGLHWPRLGADLYVPSLLQGVFGTKHWERTRPGQ